MCSIVKEAATEIESDSSVEMIKAAELLQESAAATLTGPGSIAPKGHCRCTSMRKRETEGHGTPAGVGWGNITGPSSTAPKGHCRWAATRENQRWRATQGMMDKTDGNGTPARVGQTNVTGPCFIAPRGHCCWIATGEKPRER